MSDDETPKRRLSDQDPTVDPARIDKVEQEVEDHVEGADGLHDSGHAHSEQSHQDERTEDLAVHQGERAGDLARLQEERIEDRQHHDDSFAEVLRENRALRDDVSALTTAVETLNGTLSGLVTKHQLQQTMETRMRSVERNTKGLVDAKEVKLRTEHRRASLRQRALIRSQIAVSLFITIVGMVVAVSVVDIHGHRAHVEPVEQRLDKIEELIAQVDRMVEDELPNLLTDPYPTSSLGPLAPAPQQTYPPVGWSLYAFALVGLLITSYDWRHARKDMATTGLPANYVDEEPPPPPRGPLERRRADRRKNETPRTEE